jgi:heme-degrading monooxygenase HmoA
MIVEQVELAVLDGHERHFEAALCEVRQRVFMSAGFRGFTAAQGVEQPSTYLVRVLWETPEELLAFAETRFDRAWEPVQLFLAAKPRVDHFVECPNLSLNGPGVVTDLAWMSEESP